MSIRHMARTGVRSSFASGSHLLRCGLGLLLLIGIGGQAAFAADSSNAMAPVATLSPLQPDSGSATVAPGANLTLEAVKKIGNQGVAGQEVDWAVTGSGPASLTPVSSMTTAQSSTSDAGVANTVFEAATPGKYVVTATTQKNPACMEKSCASYVSIRYAIEVVAASTDTSSTSSNASRYEAIGAAAAIATGIALAANNNNDHNQAATTVMRTLAKAGGDGQTSAANKPLAQPLRVHAENNGANAATVLISWSASGGAVLSASLSNTDASGTASIQVLSVGPGPGPVTVTATRSDDASASVSFTVNVLQPPPPSLNIVSGDGQSGFANRRAANPLVVEADLGNKPQAGVPIIWSASGGATVTSVSNGGNTNASGRSSAVITFGPTAGPVDVTATRNDGTGLSQTFHLNAVIINTLAKVSGDQQSGPPHAALPAPLVVQARTNNVKAAGVTINWTASGGATLSSPTSVTGVGGQAGVRVTNTGPGPGPIIVTATRADDPTASVQFSESIFPPNLSKVSGDFQSGLIGSKAAASLNVLLVDGAGVPVSSQPIAWTVTGGTATLSAPSTNTNANGHATVKFTYGNSPGTIKISASAYSGSQTVVFTETATTPTTLMKTGGDFQTGPPSTTLPLRLKVQIQAPGSPTLSGVPITFTVVSGSASVTKPSTTTDGTGSANTQVVLGLTPGTVSVLAQVSGGGPSQTFTETVSGTLVPGALTIVSGDAQQITPNTASAPLVVVLKGNGAPLSGQTINWSTSSGTLSVASSMTGANGQASATITPNTTGPITVTASFPGFAQYVAAQVTFSENTTLATLPTLTSNDQSIGTALDTACTSLQKIPNRTPQQQDLLNQCLSLNASSGVSASAAAAAVHALTPAVAETQTQTASTATTAQFDNLSARMNALRGGASGISLSGLEFENNNGSLAVSDVGSALLGVDDKPKQDEASSFSRWGVFASGQIGRQDGSAQGSTPAYNLDIHGLTFGVDYRETDQLVLGGAVGYTRQTTDLTGGQGDLSMNGWSLSGYATWYRKSNWYLDSSITWGSNNYNSRRHIAYALPLPDGSTAVVDQLAQASSGGDDLAGSLTFGRDFNNKAWASGLYGKLQYSHQNFDAFQERLNASLPGSGLGLRVESRTDTSVASVLGGKIDHTSSTRWGVVIPHAEIEWQHEFRSDPNAFRAFFVNDPTGTPILITGDAIDTDFFRLGLGMSFVFTHGRSGFILYDKTFGRSGITQDNLSIGFRMEF